MIDQLGMSRSAGTAVLLDKRRHGGALIPAGVLALGLPR
jgi:hypothetical protein